MIVYKDFFNYKTGIYEKIVGEKDGGHSIKVIGWGKD
jgi:cathepsin B